ncbi:MAG: hypothetical protein JWO32_1689 [Bacteroidetes bacterium]|nr:hypothetical protein [Bacteroidota bacterium]
MNEFDKYFSQLKKLLEPKKIKVSFKNDLFIFTSSAKSISLFIPFDLLVSAPEKLAAIAQSRLSLNTTVFARNCEVKKIDKMQASGFLDTYHLMNSTQSAFNYGLFLKEELLAVASFSKGRKMDRLKDNQRSFELIRFCCKEGITVTGGLSKLISFFCKEKNAGDVMTYIDKQFSSGQSFIKTGFIKCGESEPHYCLVNKKTFQRTPLKNPEESFDNTMFYIVKNEGSIKLVFTPLEK